MKLEKTTARRNSSQPLMPAHVSEGTISDMYDLYPSFPIGEGKIEIGYKAIAEKIAGLSTVMIDGYIGVLWDHFREELDAALIQHGISTEWIGIADFMLPEEQIKQQVKPFLGGDDPVFGTKYTGNLTNFYDMEALKQLSIPSDSDLCILYGCGAALTDWEAPLIYVDLPKNELQYRSRAGSVANLGMNTPSDPKMMYKRFYFVDWVVLNKHKKELLPHIDWIVDEQRPDDPTFIEGSHFRKALNDMSQNYFRARPWFEPGVWGGQWCKKHIPSLPQNVQNYAWSFELISPENGIMFSDNEYQVEVSFDWLMYGESEAILGDSADVFGDEFPIRFDFLDTFDGGNLSIQCHPKPSFIREQFGESFTQNETYYMLDCKDDAQVYLGFQEDVDPEEFRSKLEQSAANNLPVAIKDYIQTFTANKHDLFLIPHGAVHCSGINNMVLEISATPYIFTFKMYDWLRFDLNGQPRPLNIDRAFENLNFDYKGQRVEEELISEPYLLEQGEDWQVIHLPTHKHHFYDIHRIEFGDKVELTTDDSCQVMSLVEGSSVLLETENGRKAHFSYAETFVVPAAANSFRLINEGDKPAKVVKAFIKPNIKLDRY